MSVILSTRHEGTTAVVLLQGRLTLSPLLGRISPRVKAMLETKRSTGLILNLTRISEIDTAGLGALVEIRTWTARRGIRSALVNLSPRIEQIFAITRLDGVFAIFEDEKSALEHVAKA